MSQSGPQPNPARRTPESQNRKGGTLSKVAGAGTGSGIIVFVQTLGLPQTVAIGIEAMAPWVAVGVGIIGPIIGQFCIHKGSMWGLKRTLSQAKEFAASTTAGSQSHADANRNVEELEKMISELIKAEGDWFARFRGKQT